MATADLIRIRVQLDDLTDKIAKTETELAHLLGEARDVRAEVDRDMLGLLMTFFTVQSRIDRAELSNGNPRRKDLLRKEHISASIIDLTKKKPGIQSKIRNRKERLARLGLMVRSRYVQHKHCLDIFECNVPASTSSSAASSVTDTSPDNADIQHERPCNVRRVGCDDMTYRVGDGRGKRG